ncbi:MAG TPA: DUF3616 domain-containing protein [Candidatus Acidoferrum sp.]|nr:DUF3616 domain-containing protein [Candidatus Acidoferrum sp.]
MNLQRTERGAGELKRGTQLSIRVTSHAADDFEMEFTAGGLPSVRSPRNQPIQVEEYSRSGARIIKLLSGLLILTQLGCSKTPAEELRTESFQGMCDASAIVALNSDLFVAGDDEDSVMRVFSRSRGSVSVHQYNLAPFLRFGANDEADLEGSTRIGDRLYWITSHGNNRKGKEQESRQRFFAITVPTNAGNVRIEPVGQPYTRLLDDLIAEPAMRQFNLHAALSLPPKTPGALNIEGLTATAEGHLLLGFRNPVPRGKALLVPLLNPSDLLEGKPPKFGAPRLIDLGGYGVRSIERWRDGYLIIAGSIDGKGKSRLYHWDGGEDAPQIQDVDFAGINPEALSIIDRDGTPELLVVSDDGTRKVNGVECKQLKDPMQKSFRAMVVPIAPHLAAKP